MTYQYHCIFLLVYRIFISFVRFIDRSIIAKLSFIGIGIGIVGIVGIVGFICLYIYVIFIFGKHFAYGFIFIDSRAFRHIVLYRVFIDYEMLHRNFVGRNIG